MAIRQARAHIQSLTGLRFYLASAIFVMHFSQFVLASLFPNSSIFSDYTSAGHLAVDAFFFGGRELERLSPFAHSVCFSSDVDAREMRAREVDRRLCGVPSGRVGRVMVTLPAKLR